ARPRTIDRARDLDHQLALAFAQRRLDRVGEPPAIAADYDPIDDELDRVLLLLVERADVFEPHDHAVDAHAREAGLAQLDEQLAELALAVFRLRREHGRLRLVRQPGELVDDLRRRARADRTAAVVAALLAG